MKKGIEAIEAQIDSVTAYRQRERRRDPEWERAHREVDREEEAQMVADYKARQRTSSMLSIQGEQFDEPFGFCS